LCVFINYGGKLLTGVDFYGNYFVLQSNYFYICNILFKKMKVTEKQLQIMFRVLEGSLSISDRTDMNLFGYNKETRLRIFNQVLNQQSNEIRDVKNTCEESDN